MHRAQHKATHTICTHAPRVVVGGAVPLQRALQMLQGIGGGALIGKPPVGGQEEEAGEEVVGFGGGAVHGREHDSALVVGVGEVLKGLEDGLGHDGVQACCGWFLGGVVWFGCVGVITYGDEDTHVCTCTSLYKHAYTYMIHTSTHTATGLVQWKMTYGASNSANTSTSTHV